MWGGGCNLGLSARLPAHTLPGVVVHSYSLGLNPQHPNTTMDRPESRCPPPGLLRLPVLTCLLVSACVYNTVLLALKLLPGDRGRRTKGKVFLFAALGVCSARRFVGEELRFLEALKVLEAVQC